MPGCVEHYVLHAYRTNAGFIPQLCLVIEKDGQMIGAVMCAQAEITRDDCSTYPVMTLGPIGILPEYHRMGYGKILLDYVLEKATELGFGAVCLEGNISFYGKSGFVTGHTLGIDYHGEERGTEVPYFLVKELKEGYLNGIGGVYNTPQGYFIDFAAAEEYDKQFPHMEKLKLPGQLG